MNVDNLISTNLISTDLVANKILIPGHYRAADDIALNRCTPFGSRIGYSTRLAE